jgi:fatty acid amide hydrolase
LLQDADSEAVRLLRAAGAVPFCRTNTPQTNLSYGCSNPIFGATVHPMDATRTPGGSSGGEAALMALGGSILGLGTDVGGSVRVPAAFCGVCGFKPGGGRITRKGYYSALTGQSGVTAAFGPMSPEVSAIAECMAALTSGGSRLDASVAPVPWNWGEYSSTGKLRIGYYVADGFIAATPACVRAVHQACDMLRARGHEVVPFRPPSAIEGLLLFIKLLTADGGKAVLDALQDEIIDDSLRFFVQCVTVKSSWYNTFLRSRLLRRKGKLRTADLLEAQGICTTSQLWKAQAQRTALATVWEQALGEAGVDVLVTPAHVMLAPAPHVVSSSGITLCYTQIFNVVDFPAGTVPVGHATAEDEAAMAWWPRNVLQEQFGDDLDALIQQRL